jgi:hypothetical protein
LILTGIESILINGMKPIVAVIACLIFIQGMSIGQTDRRASQYRTNHHSKFYTPEIGYPELESQVMFAQFTGGEDVFRAVQHGLAEGHLDEITRHFGKNIYLNLRSIESGYYSANQAQFVVQNFFNTHKPLSFSFTTYGESGGSLYATGRGSINVKGNREYIQVYVSLSKHKDRWVISQFNVY